MTCHFLAITIPQPHPFKSLVNHKSGALYFLYIAKDCSFLYNSTTIALHSQVLHAEAFITLSFKDLFTAHHR